MVLKYICILIAVTQFANAAIPCEKPNGDKGVCKPINECPSLNAHYKNGSQDSRLSEWIRRSHCGFTENLPKVCCPLAPSAQIPQGTSAFITSNLLPDKDSCGISTQMKIFGGEKTDIDELPWMVLLEYKNDENELYTRGAGALINDRYVLTAAHCLEPNLVSARLGEYDTSSNLDCVGNDCAPQYLSIPIEEKIPFDSFNISDPSVYHDIALLRLKEKINYSDFIKPICLPTTVEEIFNSHSGENLMVSGWGKTENASRSNIKLKAQITGKPIAECSAKYKPARLDAGQLCAGGDNGKDACKDDSGGPLMAHKRNEYEDVQWYAVGIGSFGRSCGVYPGVYTKVAKYMGWIVENLKS